MTVRCPQCDTAYRAPPRSQLGTEPTFRCSRCEHVFDPEDAIEVPAMLGDAAEPEADAARSGAASADIDGDERPGASTARFALRTLVGVTLAFALLSFSLLMHLARVADLMAYVPMVGPDLAATHVNPVHVQLTDVRGEFVRLQGDTLVFVITGTAVNNAPVAVSAIEIRGRVLGAEERRQRVFAGAAPHDVHGLSERETDLLQTLRPPKDWRLPPGQDGAFLVAFVDPPLPLREFAAEVVAVRRRE